MRPFEIRALAETLLSQEPSVWEMERLTSLLATARAGDEDLLARLLVVQVHAIWLHRTTLSQLELAAEPAVFLARNRRWLILRGGALSAVLVGFALILATFAFQFGGAHASRAKLDLIQRSIAWTMGPEGIAAERLAKAGLADAIARCSINSWTTENGSCVTARDPRTGQTFGFKLPPAPAAQ